MITLRFFTPLLSLLFIFLVGCIALNAQAQQRTFELKDTVKQPLVLQPLLPHRSLQHPSIVAPFSITPTPGDRQVYQLTVDTSGRLIVHANWPSTIALALILNGPGQTGYYARKDGPSPLTIDFEITPELLEKGNQWKLSVVNFKGQGPPTVGRISLSLPKSTASTASPEAIVERTIQPDGSVLIKYADGTRKHMYRGGVDLTRPDGTVQRSSFIEVQVANLPDFPTEGQTVIWLQAHNDNLLNIIQALVDNDETAIQNYLAHEGEERPLYEKINKRTRAIQWLTSGQ
ncbi:hypothetical protein Nhal_0283 [Nitrosococcus halophilus Nc 4]|uniref:Uncharacterized protein n=1 Tax=Nitrosococcus halophilus (strain Nc4) TaxID=472759 RepID=D5BUT2_NITHN|nr:hypothetical protein [Nitrosococcus halophilus]ADE13482.1 hypothetical protein Nhal_0283 [Nitrosococcus halophilus Nc 4]